ncbi:MULTISPECIES: SlyX family protein [Neisseria]|uniref:SlyX family protein n=1 Tax=Neisseria TaxID=482 RepID=UPI0006CE8233|nr:MULTISPECIES: SlyX family protein [Neisseria]KPN72266.1 hypothetical protein AKG09_02565 [Neisseria sp. 83E34]QMT36777.1 SlyX family protein [Neisseria wadsworthii]
MNDKTALENRITELEIQQALQEDLLQSLSDTIARLQQTLDLQQAQLRLLYNRLQDKGQDDDASYSLSENIPPHY